MLPPELKGYKMISKVGICNLALTKIGTNTIVNLTESTENARRLNIIYEQLKKEVLRVHAWTFATKIESLAELADEEIINYDYLYVYPVKCLYINKIYDESETDINNYKILLTPTTNAVCIASNTYQAYIEYIKDIDDVNLFDDIFVEAFAARLASELAMPLLGDTSMANKFLQEYQYQVSLAKRADKQERHQVRNISSPYLEAR